jgi:hypothetical protein
MKLTIDLDDDDQRSILEAMGRRQMQPIPFGGSDLPGALIAEICRGWMEFMDLSAKKKGTDEAAH